MRYYNQWHTLHSSCAKNTVQVTSHQHSEALRKETSDRWRVSTHPIDSHLTMRHITENNTRSTAHTCQFFVNRGSLLIAPSPASKPHVKRTQAKNNIDESNLYIRSGKMTVKHIIFIILQYFTVFSVLFFALLRSYV